MERAETADLNGNLDSTTAKILDNIVWLLLDFLLWTIICQVYNIN